MQSDLSKTLAWLRRDLAADMWRDFSRVLARLWRAWLGGEGHYRPDLHYMRGPGPAWRAKHGYLVDDFWVRSPLEPENILPPSSP